MEEFKRFVKEFLWDEELLQSDAATEDDDDEDEDGEGRGDGDSNGSGPDDDSAFGCLASANVQRPPSPQLLGNNDMQKLADFGRTLKTLNTQSSGDGQREGEQRQQTESNKAEAGKTTRPNSEGNDDDDVDVQVPRFARYAGGAKDIAKPPVPAVSVHVHAVAEATAEPEIEVPRFASYSGGAKATAAATEKALSVKAPAVQAAVGKAKIHPETSQEGGGRRRSLGAGIVESDVRDTIRPPYALGTCVQVYYVTRTLETNVGATTGSLHCGIDEEGREAWFTSPPFSMRTLREGWYRGTVATLADQMGRQRIEFDDGESDWFDLTLTRHEMDPVHRHHERLAKVLDSSSSVALSTSSGKGIERMSTAEEAMQERVAEEERKTKTASLSASASATASTSAAAPTVAPPATTSAPPYVTGTRVAVKYQNNEWFYGVVATDVDKEMRQRVHFDDGDVDLFDLRHTHHAVVQATLFANSSGATPPPHLSQVLKTRLQSRLQKQDALLSASDDHQQHHHQQVERVHQDLMRELDAIVGKRDAVESAITYVSASVDKAAVGARIAVLWDYGDGDSSWYVTFVMVLSDPPR